MMISSVPLYLIAAALGYRTVTDASTQSSPSRRAFGRILGMIIITVSLAMIVLPLVKSACVSSSVCSVGKSMSC